MQPDRCQKRQKVCNDVSLHRLCRYHGQKRGTDREVGGTEGGGARIRGTEMERRRRTNTAGQRGQRWEPTQRTGEKDERVKNMRDGERGK